MRKFLKLIIFVLIIIGISFTIMNFITTDGDAERCAPIGTKDDDGECMGEPLNC